MSKDLNLFDITSFGARSDPSELQDKAVQAALDACRDAGGGAVVVPAGHFLISGVRMWDHTTLELQPGAVLIGSADCRDYPVWDIPKGIELRTDQEMIPYYEQKHRPQYRRAMISAYGVSDISLIGGAESLIDGSDCYDADGEEGFRGPHGIFFSNCRNVTLRGYTIRNSGNFMHQLDKCANTEMSGVASLAGHDGIHLNCCTDTVINDCIFRTGDDCVAGIGVNRLTVSNCELNTSCDTFRIGGSQITIENCRVWGPGYYPHRMTVVKGRDDVLPRESGRHNTLFFLEYFSSLTHPSAEPSHGWLIRNCSIEGVDRFLHFESGNAGALHAGTPLTEIALNEVDIKGLAAASILSPDPEHPLKVDMTDVSVSLRDGLIGDGSLLFEPSTPNLIWGYI